MREDPSFPPRAERYPTREGVLLHLVDRGVIKPSGPAADILSAISGLRPERLGVDEAAEELGVSRRKLGRVLQDAGLPPARHWVGLARALRAHRVILRGGTLRDAAVAAGYHDQFTMSNALHRSTGFRPSMLPAVSWPRLVDSWIARQRSRGALVDRSSE